MIILAIESSAKAASVCLWEEEKLLAESYQNRGLTHSRTLLPMCESMLSCCGVTLEEVDVIAAASGPGSFTGLRIGLATAKGLAWPDEKPCCGVSTLEAMAWNLAHADGVICCAMDARRGQVYNALFRAEGGTLKRLTPDRAISLEELFRDGAGTGEPQILVGDGAELCYNYAVPLGLPVTLAPAHLRFQRASGVARAALPRAKRGELCSGAELTASYLRLSQAERERQEKLKRKRRARGEASRGTENTDKGADNHGK